uniref:Histidine decarboxylase n=1 Tax=Scophthalmus maximus TaxID=52904 RepID=A0A8D3DRB7_SCOMX
MQAEEYNRRGKELVDYITQYLGSIRERRVIPDVKPGYMRELLPDTAPSEPEDWASIFNDIEKVIMPGVVHWQSPHMHAYYPSLTSWPSMLGDMLADAINCVGFTWASSPACTELEMNVMDWLCKALGLPSFFLHHHPDSRGGGILQSTVSESTLVALLAARKDKILQLRAELDQDVDDSALNTRLVAYASDQAHSSVEKAGLISLVKIRFLPTDEQLSLRGDTLKLAIQEDRRMGLVPFMLCATLGTTGVCAFDKLSELGPVCTEEGLWLHVDAAYAGSAYFCPELRWSLEGIEFAHSFVFNPSKWMMVHFDCTAFWVKDKYKLQQTFTVDPVYLRHENSHGRNALTQELLRRLTRSGTMYLIPADIHTKRIIRFTVTSQFTTADDILKDWGTISKMASTLLAETRGRNNADQPISGEDEVIGAGADQDPDSDTRSDEKEDAASGQDKAQVELWIDKAWIRPRRTMRSLSCNSEPLPYTCTGPVSGYDFDTRPSLKDAAEALPTASTATTGSSAMYKITEMPSNLLGTQVLKKLTKFYSVPSFCNQWVQCGRHQLCCPVKVSQAAQKHLSSSYRRMNCMSSSPIANTPPSPNPLESASAPKLLQ